MTLQFAKCNLIQSQATLITGDEFEVGDENYPIIVQQEIGGRERGRKQTHTYTTTFRVILVEFHVLRSLVSFVQPHVNICQTNLPKAAEIVFNSRETQ